MITTTGLLCGKKDLFYVRYLVLLPGATRVGIGLHDRIATVAIGAHPHDPRSPAPAQRPQQSQKRRRPGHLVEPLLLRARDWLPPQRYPVHDIVVMMNDQRRPRGRPLWVPTNVIVSVAVAPPPPPS